MATQLMRVIFMAFTSLRNLALSYWAVGSHTASPGIQSRTLSDVFGHQNHLANVVCAKWLELPQF